MHVAIFAGELPILSETFVMRQVAGLIDARHRVIVIVGKPGSKVKNYTGNSLGES
jgi:hypothetical protein